MEEKLPCSNELTDFAQTVIAIIEFAEDLRKFPASYLTTESMK